MSDAQEPAQENNDGGEIVVLESASRPLFDPERTDITWQEAFRYLNEFSEWPSVNDSSNGGYGYPMSRSTRAVKSNYLESPAEKTTFRSYEIGSISYNGSDYSIPRIDLIGFSEAEIAKYNTALALLVYGAQNDLPVAGLSNILGIFDALVNRGYTSVPLFDAGKPGAIPAGGQARIDVDKNKDGILTPDELKDGELEAFVSTGGDENNAERLGGLFHEISHGVFDGHPFAVQPGASWEKLLTPITKDVVRTDASYKAGYDFVMTLIELKEYIDSHGDDGDKFIVNGIEYDAGSVNLTRGAVDDLFDDPKSGLLITAEETYENARIFAVNSSVKAAIERKEIDPSFNIPLSVLQSLEEQGFLKLKSVPKDWDAAAQGDWGADISHYESRTKAYVDSNNDGKKDTRLVNEKFEGSLPQITIAGHQFTALDKIRDYAEGVVNGVTTVDGGQLGIAFGSVLGQRMTDNPFGQIVASASLKTGLGALGEFIDEEIFGGESTTNFLGHGLNGLFDELGKNLVSGGVGALSSYLTAEFIAGVGLDGVPGAIANSAGGAVVNTILGNIVAQRAILQGVGTASQLTNAIGSYIGSKLASEIKTFETVGGQIGAAVGGVYASFASTVAMASLQGVATGASLGALLQGAAAFAAANPIAAVAVVAVVMLFNTLLGGFIGSIFGGTPRSGADVEWDAERDRFVTANIYSRKGGSKEAAEQLAAAAAANFNAVLDTAGATLLDPGAVQSGNYGMRKSDYVYRPYSTTEKNAISARFSGEKGGQELVAHGTLLGLEDMVQQLAGGNVYVKRALRKSLENQADLTAEFSMETLLGDLVVAQEYSEFLAQKDVIGSLITAAPESGFASGWLVTLSRAVELEIHKRSSTDWNGGFATFLDEVIDGKIDSVSISAANVGARFDSATNERLWAISDAAGNFVGYSRDTIDLAGQSVIDAGDGNDVIQFVIGAKLNNTSGLYIDGQQSSGESITIGVAATIHAGAGNDVIHGSDLGDNIFGGDGNDVLFGGGLDDWILGGAGDDRLEAGDAHGGRGGNGNFLDGGAGDDQLFGREGSDWLAGGEGADLLDGGGGDDILSGGTGDFDQLRGGDGADQYLLRKGDGADVADEVSGAAIVGASSAGIDKIKARFDGIAAGTIKRNWLGSVNDAVLADDANAASIASGGSGSVAIAASSAGGEDAVVFGVDIGIGDIRLSRYGGVEGADLLIEVLEDGEPSGTQLLIKDWFANPFKRVEWLKFVDGTEIRIGDFTSFVVGTAGDDVLIGTTGNDFVYAGAGNDRLRLLAGNDVGNGGAGDDLVSGDDGDDLVLGGLGVDQLIGGRGKDAISGDAGSDDLYGGDGNDILSGGRGDDYVVGGAGDDVFKFARGDGQDVVFDEFSAHWTAIWSPTSGWAPGYTRDDATGEVTGPGGVPVYKNLGTFDEPNFQWLGRFDYDANTNTLYRYDEAAAVASGMPIVNAGTDMIEFGLGIDIQDIVLTRTSPLSADLVLSVSRENDHLATYAAASDSITIRGWYAVQGQIEKVAFYQTGVMAIGPGGYNLVAGTDFLDTLSGTATTDWISGGAGDDVISAGEGNDILSGNSDFDTLKGQGGDDVLYGGSGDDILDGGDGADILVGGAGLDTASYATSTAIVRAYLGASWANAGAAQGDEYHGIENLTGGTYGVSSPPVLGSADVLGGDDSDNELTGGRGDDLLMGGAGDDTYVWNGAEWADTIREGAFTVEEVVSTTGALKAGYTVSWQQTAVLQPGYSDRYYWRLRVTGPGNEVVYDWAQFAPTGASPTQPVPATWDTRGWLGGFSRTNGQQVIREKFDTSADGGQDTIEFGSGISLSDLAFERYGPAGRDDAAGPDLLIRYGTGTLDYMLIRNQFTSYGKVETLLFRDGLSVLLDSILIAQGTSALTGTAGADLLSGSVAAVDEHLIGGAGDDVLNGLQGSDWLEGGAGDDVLEGGAGAYADILDGGAHSAAGSTTGWGDTVRYVRSSAIDVDLRRTTAQFGGEAAGDILIDIENVVGSLLGNDLISGNDGGNRIDGLDGNNTLHGWGGDDVLVSGNGTDMLYGDDGDDALSAGDGDDQLWGGAGADRLAGGAGNDSLRGEAGNDVLTGGEGNDTLLDGGDGDDDILGEAGNDLLVGGLGNDLLAGGSGNDTLQGGLGDDDYYFEPGSGLDTLTDTSGINRIQFGEGIAFDDLWLTQVGQDLRIGVVGTTDAVTVTNYFAVSSAASIHSIETRDHAAFLDHPAIRTLITAMTASSAGTSPASIPASIAGLLATYWHAGGKAAPTGPASARTLTTNEDVPLAIDASLGVVDQDDNITSYAVKPGKGPAHGTISIVDAATGAFLYTPNADFNGNDQFSILVTDADNQSVEIPMVVTVNAINDAPRNLRTATGSGLAVTEFAVGGSTASGTAVGQLLATDVEGDALTWTIVEDAADRFAITIDGLVYVKTPSLLDYEADASHVIRVRATDATGRWTEQDFTVGLQNANEQNALGAIPPMTVAENLASGTVVGTVPGATDPDSSSHAFGQQRYFFLNGGATSATSWDGRYTINATTGQITTADVLNYEVAEPSRTYTIAARDNLATPGFTQSTSTVTIGIEDRNEAPTAFNWSPLVTLVAERDRVATGTQRPPVVLGDLSVIDPDIPGVPGGSYTYSVSDDRLEVIGTTLRLKQDRAFDFEEGASVSVVITATDQSDDPFSIERTVVIAIDNRDDILEGDASDDTLIGQQNRDLLYGYGGNDTLDGADGDDDLFGDAGDDHLAGGSGADKLYGDDGEDILVGGAGNDLLEGGANDGGTFDTLYGGDGDDILRGGEGADELLGGAGADTLEGGDGIDQVSYAYTTEGVAATAGVTADLLSPSANTGAAAGDTYSGIENVLGTDFADDLRGDNTANSLSGGGGADILNGRDGDDILEGGAGNDTLYGGSGNDDLRGGDGDDQLFAESGDDKLDGGAGNDTLNGGLDNDTYIVTRTSGADTINNYDPSGDDIDVLGFHNADGLIQDKDLWFEQSGNDMLISVVGTISSVLIKDWYLISDASSRANYKLDFIIAETRYSNTINVEGLVTLMATRAKPTTTTARDALMQDATYHAAWANYWGSNEAPVITAITNKSTNEDVPLAFTVTATDDITPNAGLTLSARVISQTPTVAGTSVVTNGQLVFGAGNSLGQRTLTIAPVGQSSGTAVIEVTATDAGGVSSTQEFQIVVNGVADTPTIAGFGPGSGTSGQGGIALNLNVTFPDTDGSEVHEITIAGVPASVTLSAGTYDSAAALWRLTRPQLSNLTLNAPAGWSQDLTLTAVAKATENGLTATSAAKVATVVINAPPTGATLSGTVAENTANGTLIGNVVGADPDGGTLTYALLNNAGGRFSLSSTGALTVANGALLNYEAATSHAITVRVTDSFNQYKDQVLNVAVTNVNEQNVLGTISAMAVAENLAVGTVVGTVPAASDPDGTHAYGQQRYYFLNGSTASATSSDGRYTINATTGQITTAAVLNYEAGTPSASYTIAARDNAGAAGYAQSTNTVTIGITNVNEQNVLGTISAMAVAENLAVGTVVGTVPAASDSDGTHAYGQQRYYFLNGSTASATSSDGRYTINATTGQITTAAVLNYEAGTPSASYTIAARDNAGAAGYTQSTNTVTIGITNVNEQNVLGTISAMAVAENLAVGTVVGTVPAASDPDGTHAYGQQRYYFLNGSTASATSSDGRYTINATTGQITTAAVLNYEAGTPSASYTIAARDNAGAAGYTQSTRAVTIGIADVNEAHSLQAAAFDVYERPGSTVDAVTTTSGAIINLRNAMLIDPENRNMTWAFSNGLTQMGAWQIEQDGTLKMIQATDYESVKVHSLTVRASDSNFSREAVLTLNIKDVNEDVTNYSLPNYVLAEGTGGVFKKDLTSFWVQGEVKEGRIINVGAVDPEGRALTYSLANITRRDINMTIGGSGDIDSPYPTLSITSAGVINFLLPDGPEGNDDQWQGGTDLGSGVRTHSIEYSFDVNVTDTLGKTTPIHYTVTFLRRGSSVPPIILDLDGDGLELVPYDGSTVFFDMDLDGIGDRTGWVGSDDGLLALDRNADGVINDISEISFLGDNQGALSDLEGLRAFDTNANGFLDAGDERYSEFRIWRDVDQDGVSDAGELLSLPEAGVVSVNLTMNLTGEELGGPDNVIYATSEYLATDGTSKAVGDAFLTFDPSKVEALAAPIVLDYDGDGSGLVSLQDSRAAFDMDGDGEIERTGWIASGDALLVLDRNGDGAITDIAEISYVGDKKGARTDLEGLAAFDSNADGVLDARDLRFSEFKLWFDNDGDGVSKAGELRTLAEAGITSIGLDGKAVPNSGSTGGNVVYATASFKRNDGSSGTVLDAAFAYRLGSTGTEVALSKWDGTAVPSTNGLDETPDTLESVIAFDELTLPGKSSRYRLTAAGGTLTVGLKKTVGAVDARAGELDPAAILSFANTSFGLLSPLVLDLNGNGIDLKARGKSRARFDMDGNSRVDDTSWIGKNDGFLVVDADKDGQIRSPAELSLQALKPDASSSLAALASLDTNRNGKIDEGDARFGDLRIWRDGNGNGVSDAGEVTRLADHEIASINLSAQATSDSVKPGKSIVVSTMTFERTDGSMATVANTALAFKPTPEAPRPHDQLDALLRSLEGFRDQAQDRKVLLDPSDPSRSAQGIGDARLAHIIQQMAGFGALTGEADLMNRSNSVDRLIDYFAA